MSSDPNQRDPPRRISRKKPGGGHQTLMRIPHNPSRLEQVVYQINPLNDVDHAKNVADEGILLKQVAKVLGKHLIRGAAIGGLASLVVIGVDDVPNNQETVIDYVIYGALLDEVQYLLHHTIHRATGYQLRDVLKIF